MLKKKIKFTDFNGDPCSEDHYFNMSKSELLKLALDEDGGFIAYIKRIIDAENYNKLIIEIRQLIMMAYGKKSDDGKSFLKSPEISEAFSMTAAFDALYIEFIQNVDAFVTWVKGIMPADMLAEIEANELQNRQPRPTSVIEAEVAAEKTAFLPPPPPAAQEDTRYFAE